LDNVAARMADHVTAVSGAVKDSLIKTARVPEDRITVIHNGVDLASLDGLPAEVPPWPLDWESDFLIGCIGSFTARKAQVDLVRAMPHILEGRRDARLAFIGEGAERRKVESVADELGVRDRICFAGFHPNPAGLIRRFALYVQPSRYEPFGIAVLEAMAASRAVVATTAGGLSEIVVDGETGLLVAPGDIEALARAILRLASSPESSARMGRRGRAVLEERFTVEAAIRKYEQLYEGLTTTSSRESSATLRPVG
jgi:glycosyltransferase involved in cell wall biosynthesis